MSSRRRLRQIAEIATVAALYFAAGKLGLSLAFVNASASAVWPPSGIAIALLVVIGRDLWPGIFLGAFAVNLLTNGNVAASLGIASGNLLEALTAAWMIERFANGARALERPSTIFRFAALAGLISPAISATIGVATLSIAGLVSEAALSATWITWWLGDLAGALVVAPLVILWLRPPEFEWTRKRMLEVMLLGTALVVLTTLVYSDVLRTPGGPALPAYLVVPVLLWAASRFTTRESATAIAVFSGLVIYHTLRNRGTFATGDPNASLILAQGFVSVWSVTALTLAAAVTARRAEGAQARSLNVELERTAVESAQSLHETNERLQREAEERQRAQEELRKSELRLREAQRVAHMGSWEWDVATDAVWWSEEMYAIYGLERSEFPGSVQAFLERVHPEDRERVGRAVGDAARNGQSFSFDHRIVRPDGQVRTLHAVGHALTDEEGRVVRMMGTGHDVTERQMIEAERAQWIREQAARREAVQANQLKDEFLAILSHELRNPLNAIVVWSQLLREGELDDTATERAIDAIARNAQVQNKLITDLLDLSRLNSGRLALRKRTLDPRAVLEQGLETMRPLAESKRVALEMVIEAEPRTRVLADPERLQQIVWNLVSNAVHFSPPGGRVTVTLSTEGHSVALVVEDEGPGIHPELLPVVFDAVRRGAKSQPGRSGGLGLGLAIVRRLAELHHGSAHAANRTGASGAVLTVRLPRHEATDGEVLPHAAGPHHDDGSSRVLEGIRVLIVEDDYDSADGLVRLLRRHGAEVDVADTCERALERFEVHPPQVLVSDIALPDGDGYELIERVRRMGKERGGEVPAIALTAYAGVEHSRKATGAGFQVHFAKPFETGELIEVIARLAV